MKHLIITKEQADLVRGKHGRYSGIMPVELPDGNFIISQGSMDDPDLISIKPVLEDIAKTAKFCEIKDLPKVGEYVEKDKIYFSDAKQISDYSGLVIAKENAVITSNNVSANACLLINIKTTGQSKEI